MRQCHRSSAKTFSVMPLASHLHFDELHARRRRQQIVRIVGRDVGFANVAEANQCLKRVAVDPFDDDDARFSTLYGYI